MFNNIAVAFGNEFYRMNLQNLRHEIAVEHILDTEIDSWYLLSVAHIQNLLVPI